MAKKKPTADEKLENHIKVSEEIKKANDPNYDPKIGYSGEGSQLSEKIPPGRVQIAELFRKVKVAQFHVGVELIGTKLSANYKQSEILEMPQGLQLTSKKNTGAKARIVIVPYTNVRGYELL